MKKTKKYFKKISLMLILIVILWLGIFSSMENVHAERFFQQHSTWYEKIPNIDCVNTIDVNCAKLKPNYQAIINKQITSERRILATDSEYWGSPICISDESTPIYNVSYIDDIVPGYTYYNNPNGANENSVTLMWDNLIMQRGWNLNVPIPNKCKSANKGMSSFCLNITQQQDNSCISENNPWKCCKGYKTGICSTDLPLNVIDKDGKYGWSLYKSYNCNGTGGSSFGWHAAKIKRFPLNGTGLWFDCDYGCPNVNAEDALTYSDYYAPTHADGAPTFHGTIMYHELYESPGVFKSNPVINHAIHLNVQCGLNRVALYPARDQRGMDTCLVAALTTTGVSGGPTHPDTFTVGDRIQLNPSIDCKTRWPLFNAGEIAICKAMQDYGAIVGDFHNWGPLSLRVEGLIGQEMGYNWNNTFKNIINYSNGFFIDNFRIIQPLYPDCNDTADNDNDGLIDSLDPDCIKSNDWEISDENYSNQNPIICSDNDYDGFNATSSCGIVDCDDNNININPGKIENCSNQIDDNCNNQINENCNFQKELIALWKMDFSDISGNILLDRSSKNNNCLINGSKKSDGKINGSLLFDGIDDYVDCGNNFNFSNQFTISLWINPKISQETTNNIGVIAKAKNPDWSWQLRFGNSIANYNLGFQFNTDHGSKWINLNQKLNVNNWSYITGTFNGSTAKIYLNSNLINSTNFNSVLQSNTPLIIGNEGWGPTFNGSIDEVRIYNYALNDSEILNLFNLISNNQTCSDLDNDNHQSKICGGDDCNEKDITTTECNPGDNDSNGCISPGELNNYIQRWYVSSAQVPMIKLANAIELWRIGGC